MRAFNTFFVVTAGKIKYLYDKARLAHKSTFLSQTEWILNHKVYDKK